MDYFTMIGENKKMWVTARAAPDLDVYSLWDLVESLDDIDQWSGLHLVVENGALSDFPPSDTLGRICSTKLRETIEEFSTEITWLPVEIVQGEKRHDFFYMHFADCPDVLDENRSTYVDGDILAPHISESKSGERKIFCLRQLSPVAIVHETIRNAIEHAECVGIGFESVPSS